MSHEKRRHVLDESRSVAIFQYYLPFIGLRKKKLHRAERKTDDK